MTGPTPAQQAASGQDRSASAAPVRPAGTRARSGNAMNRTRVALLTATAECVARYGVRKTTMVDVASRSKVAKATLYNHFRTKEDVLVALVDACVQDRVAVATETAAARGLAAALDELAAWLAAYPPLLTAAAGEPVRLVALVAPSDTTGWAAARAGISQVLAAARTPAGPGEVELVLRWACSQLLWPAGPGSAAALVAGLGGGRVPSAPPTPAAPPEPAAPVSVPPTRSPDSELVARGLGWPGPG